MALHELIDWSEFEKVFKKVRIHKNEVFPQGGQIAYEPLKMFKGLVLAAWYSLSDSQLEESLSVRYDFILFTGLSEWAPDKTTFCRFRQKLIELNLHDKLFKALENQIQKKGFNIKRGTLVDATIVESANRPDRIIEVVAEDRKEEEVPESSPTVHIEESKDPDARWLKKGKKAYFGYKAFIGVDKENGFIQATHVTSANKSEVKELKTVVMKTDCKEVYGDKGYASEENRQWLKENGYKDAIMHKATRGNPLTEEKKAQNKAISKVRYKVEAVFGTLKGTFRFARARLRGLKKVAFELVMKAFVFNARKLGNLLATS